MSFIDWIVDPIIHNPVTDFVVDQTSKVVYSKEAKMAAFAAMHPYEAMVIGMDTPMGMNISSIAQRTAGHLDLSADHDRPGLQESTNNGYRHIFWQSMITRAFGEPMAREVGFAHEDGLPPDLSKRAFTGDDAFEEADTTVDYLNNAIGRKVGREHPNATFRELAAATLDECHNNGFYVARRGANGNFTIEKQTMSDITYQRSMRALEHIDGAGFTPEERAQYEDMGPLDYISDMLDLGY